MGPHCRRALALPGQRDLPRSTPLVALSRAMPPPSPAEPSPASSVTGELTILPVPLMRGPHDPSVSL